MEYKHREIEAKWQNYWANQKIFAAKNDSVKPKYYVLDMFPYPSGAGLHVGHPLGYIASDIVARYKRLKGFNVLHPMGYDSFGLPAEQYAIHTGQHPLLTTEQNIKRYREQLDRIGFSFDWDREVRTSDPLYYKWTQWIFVQLFNSWYNPRINKAEAIETLIAIFEKEGFKGNNHDILTGDIEKDLLPFSADEWKKFDEKKRSDVLMNFRIAYLGEAYVNWCPALGTVLANDEVKDGVSERGGHPVERKLMKQWSMRITAYAQRLLDDLQHIDWTESIKEAQRNWIGRSQGCSIKFKIENSNNVIEVFTTRPDTLFGVSYLTLAPEHELVNNITTSNQKENVNAYVTYAKNRSERERQADVKKVTGVFTGAYAIHPFTNEKIQIWIGDYVLAGYGTGAVMAVPAHDARDFMFAKHFNLPIKQVVETPNGWDLQVAAYEDKKGKIINSSFINGMEVTDAIAKCTAEVEKNELGKGQINYRLRDAVFGRQRYWGEPIPVYYKDGIPHVLNENELPLTLPDVDKYLPTEDGEPPLARAKNWKYKEEYEYEHTTMPGWAGSSWYFLRYMDANNTNEFVSKKLADYWKEVDLYIGGAEHATGHLLYVRFWTKFLNDRGFIAINEPAKKLINQGMIGGQSKFVYRVKGKNQYVSYGIINNYETVKLHIDVNIVDGDELNIEAFRNLKNTAIDGNTDAELILENGKYICGSEVEKMSKSKFNVITPDDLCERYGADAFRMYEMFLGPLVEHKPWDTKGIEGVARFLKKLWRLYFGNNEWYVSNDEPTNAEYKVLHKCIKRVTEDIERYSFNTVVSTLMITVNELGDLKCNKKKILEPLCIMLAPYAPHISEELWSLFGNNSSVAYAEWPLLNETYLQESVFAYPISFNGKTRFNFEMDLTLNPKQIEELVLAHSDTQKYLEGKLPKKIIVVPRKIVNIVI